MWVDLFANNNILVSLHMTQLAAVEVNHQLAEPRVVWLEVDLHLGILPWFHCRLKPGDKYLKIRVWAIT
jgi:hypothetical protein